jgi:histidinol dehydrogenase
MKIYRDGAPALESFLSRLESRRRRRDSEAARVARRVRRDVEAGGDEAVSKLVREFDGVELAPSELLMQPAGGDVDEPLREAIDLAIERVTQFHEPQRVAGYSIRSGESMFRHLPRPLSRVGIYVPGGEAVYLTTLIMCAVPARLAGVRELVVATPPRVASRPEFQYVCRLLGVREVYQCGGPAAIAALAGGTSSLARVDKIVGPGNGYVTAAKRLFYGEVGLDMTAGPSEIVIVADDTADVRIAAADLRAQAEHGADSVAIAITTSETFARSLHAKLGADSLAALKRNGAIVVTRSLDDAVSLVNRLAPEHAELLTRDAERLAGRIENCGAIYVGHPSGVVFGDYAAGPNHVLPTGGSARFFSPLGVYDFYKRSNVVILSESDAAGLAPMVDRFARFERLPFHAASARERITFRTEAAMSALTEVRGRES